MTVVENRMLSDASWNEIEYHMTTPRRFECEEDYEKYVSEQQEQYYDHPFYEGTLLGKQYKVDDEYALDFAKAHLTPYEQDMVTREQYTDDEIIEWFYSGSWVHHYEGERKW